MLDVLLVHSPLVGPLTVGPLAEALGSHGHRVAVPDLTGVALEPRPSWLVEQLTVGGATHDVVVAHSGAGAVLPEVAVRVRARVAVFLDAALPVPGEQSHLAPSSQRQLLEQHVGDGGLLRPWLDWWPTDVVASLLPDPEVRARVARECPRLPLSFYDHAVPLPPRWVPSAYVALGRAHGDELARARRLDWPTRELGLTHLATVTHADTVADALCSVIEDGR